MKNYPQYSTKQKWIHWLTAILVFLAILLPLLRGSLAQYLSGMANLFVLHKSLGIMVFILTVWRIIVIIKQGIPEVQPKHEKLQRILSKSVQGIIYLLLLILPLSGYLMSSRDIHFLGFITLPALTLPNGVYGVFHSVHIIGAYLLIFLLCLHVLAAFYHHLWVKDNVLKSMLPSRWFNSFYR
ncbi:cytochrome b [Orbus sturtevantii]|uniref:cytochrome b n=1 Tax=Orbus sturtevantii TaxID=3074109 RepID=UPI00370DDFBC